MINGVVLGLLTATAAWIWQGNAYLGLVVGGAMAANTLVAVSIGGTVPLLLRRLNLDPALASGPILTTITDMCGFFLVLSFAAALFTATYGLRQLAQGRRARTCSRCTGGTPSDRARTRAPTTVIPRTPSWASLSPCWSLPGRLTTMSITQPTEQDETMRLLVIEDNPKMAALIKKGLTEQGYAVDVARSGHDGEFMAAGEAYDAVILDLMLPDQDGLIVCRNLRRRGVRTPILMLTALSTTNDKVHRTRRGRRRLPDQAVRI